MKRKKIIFAAPLLFRLNELIILELEACDFEVTDVSFLHNEFKYENIFERLKSFIIKNFGRNKYYKTSLKYNRNKTWIKQKLAPINEVDYAFIIRPDVFPLDILKEITSKSKKSVGYQWDGLNRFPNVYKTIPIFDLFYVFDKKDLNVPSTRLSTNFYPEAYKATQVIPPSDIYYAGSYNKSRIKDLEDIIDYAYELGLNIDYSLYSRKKSHQSNSHLKITDIAIDYFTNLEHVVSTKILIDVVNPTHEGLSFRTFEAIGFRKKLITTNKSIAQYDFYNPNNILIWDKDSTKMELKQFIELPFIEIDDNIRRKYGFRSWIKYMLNEIE